MIRRLSLLLALAVGTAACNPELPAEDAVAAVQADDDEPGENGADETPPDSPAGDDPEWTAAEQEAIEWFGLERARPTLLHARDFAAACPAGDFDVFPETDGLGLFGAASTAAPSIEDSAALSYVDVLVRLDRAEQVPLALYEDEPPVLALRGTVTEVLWTGPSTPDGAVAVGDDIVAQPRWEQPCEIPAQVVAGLGVYRYDDGTIELSTQVIAAPDGRPGPAARWLTAAAVLDYTDFHGLEANVDLLVELIGATDAFRASLVGLGCVPEEGDCPPTPGPYGEWRVARGHDRDPDAPTLTEEQQDSALTDWPAMPWEERPLSDILEDVPSGADEALGITWAWREAQLTGDLADELGMAWLGLRWPDVGVLCCFNVEDSGLQGVFGFGAQNGPVELVGIPTGAPVDPATAVVLRRWEQWPGGEIITLRAENGEVVGP